MAEQEALYLVDGSGFIFRAYHALPPLTTKSGLSTGAVYGFTQMLIKLETDHRPSHLAVVFDAGSSSFRNELFSEYKANRVEPPDDLKPQFGLVRKVVETFNIPVLEAVGFEADDLIATLVRQARERAQRVVVVSSDKDLMQLVVDGKVVLHDTMKNVPHGFTYDEKAVEEKFGVPPAKLGDVLALMGDSVDNIPGIPGVGPKTAAALIQAYGSVENLIAHADDIGSLAGLRGAKSVAEKVKTHVEAVRLSRQLVSLDDHVAFPVELDALRRKEPDMAKLESLLRELEFFRLLERLKPVAHKPPTLDVDAEGKAVAPTTRQGADGAVGAAVVVIEPPLKIEIGKSPPVIITDEGELRALASELLRTSELGVALESTATPPSTQLGAALIGLALASPGRPTVYVPLSHRYLGAPAQLDAHKALDVLALVFAAGQPRKHVHGLKDAIILLSRYGARMGGVATDPQIASYLIDPNEEHDVSSLCGRRLAATVESRAALLGSGKKALAYDTLEVARAGQYAAGQAEGTLAVGALLRAELEAGKMLKLLDDVELPLARVLAIMEMHGVRLDVEWLRKLGRDVDAKLGAIEKEVQALAGSEINLGSPKQLQELLFDKLALPGIKRTKTGWSTDADVLEELAPLHPVAAKILEHRVLAKLKGTYIDALPAVVDPKDGRLHTSYRQTVAATGRLSSTEPNLQNVPIRTELGREIRRAFVAADGCVLIAADYSQIELRVLAHLSKDPVLIDAFQKDQDIHRRTVIEMFGEAQADDPRLRSVAKMINYGIVYGLSDFGLAQRLGIERADAKRYIEGYLKTYATLDKYMHQIIEDAYRDGGTRTLMGRFRPIPELQARNRQLRSAGERMARNTPIQGTAADLLKLAMIEVQRVIDTEAKDVKMLLTVHDELVLEAPKERADAIGKRLVDKMEGVWTLDVPLKVDLGIGKNWAEAK
ncbi:MAG TPA: DNA polymerase I [Polyangia bacterium]|nr:DNA polymerase I [Polyangia bacterium]